jgi:hypothetical protein
MIKCFKRRSHLLRTKNLEALIWTVLSVLLHLFQKHANLVKALGMSDLTVTIRDEH